MIIRKDTHVIIDLTSAEVCLLKDLLNAVGIEAGKLGEAWERLRVDLIYGLPGEE